MNKQFIRHLNTWGYKAFKYSVYCLLALNVYVFFVEEWQASSVFFSAGITFNTIIEAFSSTIDTAVWVILLLLFELETYVFADEKIKGWLKLSLHSVRACCYIFVVFALYGYLTKLGFYTSFLPFQVDNLCILGDQWKLMENLNEYNAIDMKSCASLMHTTPQFYAAPEFNVLVAENNLQDILKLAWVDVINSATWLVVVLMLEIDVRHQLAHRKFPVWDHMVKHIKIAAYIILFLAATYWGVTGNFIEFWDAFLWLVAFFIIEMNVFEWQAEIDQQ